MLMDSDSADQSQRSGAKKAKSEPIGAIQELADFKTIADVLSDMPSLMRQRLAAAIANFRPL